MPKVTVAKQATFTTDDKRAQYARLVVFNHGKAEKIIAKDVAPENVKVADLQKAFKSLVGGNLLEGKDGIAYVQKMTKNGSTTGRELTVAYAQEVRPFIRRGNLAPSFGRRGGGPREKKAATTNAKAAPAKKAAAKKAPAKPKASKPKRQSKPKEPKASSPAVEETPAIEPPVAVEADEAGGPDVAEQGDGRTFADA